mmetsp:Transcript_6739/g.15335  ORF Transcript_6739/g.15335 Transcript_6739/m.15335 type:complete len:207 (-) Transcript_6739:531-1151(-)
MLGIVGIDRMPGIGLGIDRMLESGWSDEIGVMLESRRCHRLDHFVIAVDSVIVVAAADVAASEAASVVANIAAADNSPQDQHQLHWSSAEIAVAAAAAVPHPIRVPIVESRYSDYSAGSMPYPPRRWNYDRAGPAVGYYLSADQADFPPHIHAATTIAALTAAAAAAEYYDPAGDPYCYCENSTWAADDKINTDPYGPPPARTVAP